MKTARELAHELAGCEDDYTYAAEFVPRRHRSICDRLTTAIEARDAEHRDKLELSYKARDVEANDVVVARVELNAALAALKVAREALERLLNFAEFVADRLNDMDAVEESDIEREGGTLAASRAAITRISELVPS